MFIFVDRYIWSLYVGVTLHILKHTLPLSFFTIGCWMTINPFRAKLAYPKLWGEPPLFFFPSPRDYHELPLDSFGYFGKNPYQASMKVCWFGLVTWDSWFVLIDIPWDLLFFFCTRMFQMLLPKFYPFYIAESFMSFDLWWCYHWMSFESETTWAIQRCCYLYSQMYVFCQDRR